MDALFSKISQLYEACFIKQLTLLFYEDIFISYEAHLYEAFLRSFFQTQLYEGFYEALAARNHDTVVRSNEKFDPETSSGYPSTTNIAEMLSAEDVFIRCSELFSVPCYAMSMKLHKGYSVTSTPARCVRNPKSTCKDHLCSEHMAHGTCPHISDRVSRAWSLRKKHDRASLCLLLNSTESKP